MKRIFGLLMVVSMLLLFGAVPFADAMMCGDCKATPVPEPSTFILFGSMLIGALVVRKVITWDR